MTVAWILWARQGGQTKPLGAYVSEEVAWAAEEVAWGHPNRFAFDDFFVSPWPLRDTPTLNFRIEMKS